MIDNSLKNSDGYIALISAIIISLVLMMITFSLSIAGFFQRFDLLDAESKEQSLALARACVDDALLDILNNSNYIATNENVTVDTKKCSIISVEYNAPMVGQITLKTQAVINKAYTNLKAIINSVDASIISLEETEN